MKTQRLALTTLLLALLAAVTGCTTVPETGRSTVNLYKGNALAADAATSFAQLKQETPVSKDAAKTAQVKRVGYRIVQVARLRGANIPPPEQWEFVVFADPNVNAFAMPGGKVGFYEGIWQVFKDDDDVAVVMGHEVAHVVADHGGERVTQQLGVSLVGVGLQYGLGQSEVDSNMQNAILAAYGLGSQLGIILPYSRAHESEADEIGLIYMAQAGYDPRRAVLLWQNMGKLSGGSSVPEFLSTHPVEASRVKALEAQLPSVMPLYEANKDRQWPQP